MTTHRLLVTPLAVAVVAAALVACHSTTQANPQRSASAQQHSASTLSAFVGDWYMHAGDLNIQADGSIVLVYPLRRDTLPPAYPTLHLRIDAVSGATATAVVVSSEDDAVKVGDKFTLTRTPTGISLSNASGDSTRWCDTASRTSGLCGA